jgi:ribosomal protein S6--L-glutamate ligase
MIVSYHPLYEGDVYGLAAGRDPDPEDEARMRAATGVVLPQGCRESWYRAARRHCPNVFPDYGARFRYPGKPGHIRLFRDLGVPHPPTRLFEDLPALEARVPNHRTHPPLAPPFVVKFAWGDEGRTVFRISNGTDWRRVLDLARRFESTGQRGFLAQRLVPCGGRSLRVVVIGNRRTAYWRVADENGPFGAGVGDGARIDPVSDPDLRRRAVDAADALCRRTGINLAGLDVLFSTDPAVADPSTPLFIEINYFFGRRGIGGSERFYRILIEEIRRWAEGLGPARRREAG